MAKVQVGSSRDRCDRQLLIVAFDAALCASALDPGPVDEAPGAGIIDCLFQDVGETFGADCVVAIKFGEASD